MFFGKNEKKKHHPWAMLTLGMLAGIGAVGIVGKSKCCIKSAFKKMSGMFKKACKECDKDCGCESSGE